MAQNLTGVPGGAEVWDVGGKIYLVYFVPETDPPVPLMYHVKDLEDLQGYLTGQGELQVDRNYASLDEARAATGGIDAGLSTELVGTEEHPFEGFVRNYEDEARVMPMLRDPEVLAIFAEALLEGRAPTQSELENTDYWRSRNAQQREWERIAAADPQEAARRLDEGAVGISEQLVQMGYQGDADSLGAYYAELFLTGAMGEQELERQLLREVDPYVEGASPFAGRYLGENHQIVTHGGEYFIREGDRDYLLTGPGQIARYVDRDRTNVEAVAEVNVAGTALDLLASVDGNSALGGVEYVRALVETWLGPQFASGWTQENLEEWASRIRRNEGAEDQLVDILRGQRVSLFPEYDENQTYEDIAGPWRGFWAQRWGQAPDETDELFHQVLRLNDASQANTLLMREGRRRGVDQVVNKTLDAIGSAVGGNVMGRSLLHG